MSEVHAFDERTSGADTRLVGVFTDVGAATIVEEVVAGAKTLAFA